MSTPGLVDTKQPKRRQYSEALKRQMVAETQVPGASVSIVARRHDVNSNQLFQWRRQLLPEAAVESSAMASRTPHRQAPVLTTSVAKNKNGTCAMRQGNFFPNCVSASGGSSGHRR